MWRLLKLNRFLIQNWNWQLLSLVIMKIMANEERNHLCLDWLQEASRSLCHSWLPADSVSHWGTKAGRSHSPANSGTNGGTVENDDRKGETEIKKGNGQAFTGNKGHWFLANSVHWWYAFPFFHQDLGVFKTNIHCARSVGDNACLLPDSLYRGTESGVSSLRMGFSGATGASVPLHSNNKSFEKCYGSNQQELDEVRKRKIQWRRGDTLGNGHTKYWLPVRCPPPSDWSSFAKGESTSAHITEEFCV